jgi:beta-1,4-glucosyltransferase
LIGSFALAGFEVKDMTSEVLIRFLRRRTIRKEKIAVGFVNHNFVTTCQNLGCKTLDRNDFILVNDGIGMQIAAFLRFGRGFRENLNGTDFVPRYLREARGHRTVYLIGSTQDVVERAAVTISAIPDRTVVGFCDGFSIWDQEKEVIKDIAALAPDILLVGLGNPIQEQWIVENWAALNANVIFGVGALFEWMTGARRRAPVPLRRLHLEWAYRFVTEPRRLFQRYTVGIVRFFSLVVWDSVSTPRHEQRPVGRSVLERTET